MANSLEPIGSRYCAMVADFAYSRADSSDKAPLPGDARNAAVPADTRGRVFVVVDDSEMKVKAHRGRVMRKMKADSLTDLVTMDSRRHPAEAATS